MRRVEAEGEERYGGCDWGASGCGEDRKKRKWLVGGRARAVVMMVVGTKGRVCQGWCSKDWRVMV